jgi:hypothetical protein
MGHIHIWVSENLNRATFQHRPNREIEINRLKDLKADVATYIGTLTALCTQVFLIIFIVNNKELFSSAIDSWHRDLEVLWNLRLLDINLMANLGLNKSRFGWWKFDLDSDSNPNGKNLLSWIVKPHT